MALPKKIHRMHVLDIFPRSKVPNFKGCAYSKFRYTVGGGDNYSFSLPKNSYIVRLYDSSFGLFSNKSIPAFGLSPDPHEQKYPNLSPYSAFADNPLLCIDPDGRDIIIKWGGKGGGIKP